MGPRELIESLLSSCHWLLHAYGHISLLLPLLPCLCESYHMYCLLMINKFLGEHLSWDKISYLKDWKKHWGSPFTKGTCRNIREFCGNWNKQLQRWRLPKLKRSQSDTS